jgi:CRP-like cAMP-binding protein
MGIAKRTAKSTTNKVSDKAAFRDLVPLNSLSEEQFQEVSKNIVVQDVSAGRYLFGEGDQDNRSIYLLDGEVNFVDGSGRVSGVVIAGTDPARYPLANQQPRLVSARVATRSIIATIDSTLLDVLLTFDQTSASKSVSAGVQADDDWLTRMFQSDAFLKMPPEDIQRMLKQMGSVPVNKGDVVINQGDEGDYFYIIREGKCTVTRRASNEGWEVPLAELSNGDCFGEEALVSDARRNASVTMMTDGTLMRLSKQDFLELLKKPLVHYVDYTLALSMIKDGDMWLDVRLPDEYAIHAFKDSLNIPLLNLRDNATRLLPNRKYIICCDTGRRSASAAFLLSQRGFEVYVLEGGLNKGVPPEVFGFASEPADTDSAETTAAPRATARAVPAAENAPPAGNATAKALQQERDAAMAEAATAKQQLAELQGELDILRAHFTLFVKKAERLEAACDETRQAREEIEVDMEKLKSRFARPLSLK